MVHFMQPLEVVNGMCAARARGHGCVQQYLGRVGVPRSTGYRWEKDLRWLAEFGPQELRRLRRERDRLAAILSALAEERAAAPRLSREWERAFVLQAAVLGTSDEEVAVLLERAGGRCLCHETINAMIAAASAVAREVFRRYFLGVGRVGAADEIFLGRVALLLVVEPRSLLVSGVRLAAGRGAEDWEPLFAELKALERCASDAGRGLSRASKDAGHSRQMDMFHALPGLRDALGRLERTYEKKQQAATEARRALEEACAATKGRAVEGPRQRARMACQRADRVAEKWCWLGELVEKLAGAFDHTTPDGKLNTPSRAQGIVAEVLAALAKTREGRRLAEKLRILERQPAFAHLDELTKRLGAFRLEQVGPDRAARLARLVAATLAWRRRDKDPVELLRQASTGSLADEVELAVIEIVDFAIRSSSAVECVNSRIRLVQVARKRMSEDFVFLLAVYHNMRTFGRGSVRKGKTAAELAGIPLPTNDWIELLDLTAKTPRQAGGKAA